MLTDVATAHVDGYKNGYIQDVVRRSSTTKARLLHYFPASAEDVSSAAGDTMDSWCGVALE